MIDLVLNPIAFATLLTALYVLRFRGWQRPFAVAAYFAFFGALALADSEYATSRGTELRVPDAVAEKMGGESAEYEAEGNTSADPGSDATLMDPAALQKAVFSL